MPKIPKDHSCGSQTTINPLQKTKETKSLNGHSSATAITDKPVPSSLLTLCRVIMKTTIPNPTANLATLTYCSRCQLPTLSSSDCLRYTQQQTFPHPTPSTIDCTCPQPTPSLSDCSQCPQPHPCPMQSPCSCPTPSPKSFPIDRLSLGSESDGTYLKKKPCCFIIMSDRINPYHFRFKKEFS
ncbi:Hypothetical predicted protein [Mytilus galloprovincialis]|uniref:Uncharacterized protein n=1 Tax=Mytilus galloprovincialis TaxID=29158 RepID=A0A8B6CAP7_MYTGA|nr:Hypothetical predicted protein [Mytilus galloprovincialis]